MSCTAAGGSTGCSARQAGSGWGYILCTEYYTEYSVLYSYFIKLLPMSTCLQSSVKACSLLAGDVELYLLYF